MGSQGSPTETTTQVVPTDCLHRTLAHAAWPHVDVRTAVSLRLTGERAEQELVTQHDAYGERPKRSSIALATGGRQDELPPRLAS